MNKKGISVLLTMALAMATPLYAMAEAIPANGVYEGSANGMGGAVKVAVTVEDGKISDVEVLEHKETAGISDPAIEQIPQAIVDAQSTDVEAVTGATVTSEAIKEAVAAALSGEGTEEAGELEITIEPDVIVVGAGMAGLSASVRAAELGANVLVLEQNYRVGGSANTAGGSISGAGYKIQKAAGIEDSPELFYQDFVTLGGEEFMNTEIAKVHAERSGAAIDWLQEDVGVEFSDKVDSGSYLTMDINRVTYTAGGASSGGGSYFVKGLSDKLQSYIDAGTVQLCLDTLVTDIVLNDNGDVTGVMVGDKEISAPSTIIATGGYGYCERWLKEFNFTNITSNDPNTAIGSGYDFARKAGAAFDNMNYSSCYGGSVPVTGFQASLRCNINYNGSVWINTNGDRVFNEPRATSMDKRTVWRTSDQNIIYVVFAENMMTEDKPLFTGMMSNSAPFTTEEKIAELIEKGYVFKADTIAELAEKIGTPNLEATLTKYDEDVAKGEDSVFGRTDNLLSFEEGPYYAVYTVPYLMMTAGGPRINGQGQLMREDGTAVGNVYLAGEIIGSANIAGHNTIGGIGHGICATWGCISAESAVQNAGK
ncbi:MAG: FAD-dependent oxidoreductase [Clostridiales bacterium]|nr:FAD-dependent oxidoreductase [Clostridiales bacterium]